MTVKGPKGTLSKKLHRDMIIEKNADTLLVKRPSEDKEHKSLHGLTRTLINKHGESVLRKGLQKRSKSTVLVTEQRSRGNKLALTLGFSHPVEMDPPAGITIDVPQPNQIVISGADKAARWPVCGAGTREEPPEPYKGQGY